MAGSLCYDRLNAIRVYESICKKKVRDAFGKEYNAYCNAGECCPMTGWIEDAYPKNYCKSICEGPGDILKLVDDTTGEAVSPNCDKVITKCDIKIDGCGKEKNDARIICLLPDGKMARVA